MGTLNKFKIFGVALITFALGFIVGFASQGRQSEDEYKYLRMFTDVLRIIKENYVEPVSTKDLIYGALNGMTKSLDPFSSFFTPSSTRASGRKRRVSLVVWALRSVWKREGPL